MRSEEAMPSYIVKADPDEDFYIVWSSVTDSPHYWGSRSILMLEMREGADPERFNRADRNGSSAIWPRVDDPAYGWNDNEFIYEQQGMIARTKLRELCERLEQDEGADVSDLLEPFEDDEVEDG